MALVAPQQRDGHCEAYKAASCSYSGHATSTVPSSDSGFLKAVKCIPHGSKPAIPKGRVFAGERPE
jgi:hypothetical protein